MHASNQWVVRLGNCHALYKEVAQARYTLVVKGNSNWVCGGEHGTKPPRWEGDFVDELDSLDGGIRKAVMLLRKHGIETFASCEGGAGHPYLEATIRFNGDRSEGFKALAIAMQHNLPVRQLNRVWRLLDGEPEGPFWELTFYRPPGGLEIQESAGNSDFPIPIDSDEILLNLEAPLTIKTLGIELEEVCDEQESRTERAGSDKRIAVRGVQTTSAGSAKKPLQAVAAANETPAAED